MLQSFNERNRDLQIWVGDRLWPRDQAKVSVFDSSVQGGDAVWEGLRVYSGRRIFRLARHLQRLRHSAHALGFAAIPPEDSLQGFKVFNDMIDPLFINQISVGEHQSSRKPDGNILIWLIYGAPDIFIVCNQLPFSSICYDPDR